MEQQKEQCPEFPFFGASYPDACCIDGYLWDLDKFEDGMLYGGGEEPCPFCNTETFLEQHEDEDTSREELLKTIAYWRERYGKRKTNLTVKKKDLMEREIKFRAWDTFNKRMVYEPYYFRDNLDKGLSHEPEWQVPYQFAEQWQDVDDGIWRPCQIMQFTGLKDKNGKEIYEGDILIPSNPTHRMTRKYKIEYQLAAFKAVEMSKITPPYGLSQNISRGWEVIGNIFENKDLL